MVMMIIIDNGGEWMGVMIMAKEKMVMVMKLKMKPKMQMGMKVEQNHGMMPAPCSQTTAKHGPGGIEPGPW